MILIKKYHYKCFFSLLFILFGMGAGSFAWAERYAKVEQELPEGMELIEVSEGYKIIVPKGAKVVQEGGQIKIEGMKEFMLRRMIALEKRLEEIEEKQRDLDKIKSAHEHISSEFGELKKSIEHLEQSDKDFDSELDMLKMKFQQFEASFDEYTDVIKDVQRERSFKDVLQLKDKKQDKR